MGIYLENKSTQFLLVVLHRVALKHTANSDFTQILKRQKTAHRLFHSCQIPKDS